MILLARGSTCYIPPSHSTHQFMKSVVYALHPRAVYACSSCRTRRILCCIHFVPLRAIYIGYCAVHVFPPAVYASFHSEPYTLVFVPYTSSYLLYTTYLQYTYIQTYMHTYIHTYIHTYVVHTWTHGEPCMREPKEPQGMMKPGKPIGYLGNQGRYARTRGTRGTEQIC